MAKYQILINCERPYNYSGEGCEDPVFDCKQPQHLVIESDQGQGFPLSEIDRLNGVYQVPDCSQTGFRRFLCNTVLKATDPPEFTHYTLGDLRRK
ncbi:MAG: hypothetical protein GF368_03645 [Candidatus Aenigmarchaeota archaeon]|nr:hypothetical protein [Candidatus Aenigmarchaeota archaeon]